MGRITKVQIRRGTASQWCSTNPVLASGEPALETNTGKFKVGDGSTAWNSLRYVGFDGGDLDVPSNACCTEAPGEPLLGGPGLSVKGSWRAPALTGGYISHYVMQQAAVNLDFSTGDVFELGPWDWEDVPITQPMTQYRVNCEGLTLVYFYRIAAVNSCGQGPWSTESAMGTNDCLSSSSSSGNSCPAPSMRILLADGSQIPAGDLKPGMIVRTNHEETMELGDYEVTHVSIVHAERISMVIGKTGFICSDTHKFHADGSWKEAKSFEVGDVIGGEKIEAVENIGPGEVVRITVDSAHTYVCEGFLSHNKSPPYPQLMPEVKQVNW